MLFRFINMLIAQRVILIFKIVRAEQYLWSLLGDTEI